jgi:endonuclease YncB( thermonuclease family)
VGSTAGVTLLISLAIVLAGPEAWAADAHALDGDDIILDGVDYRISAIDAPEDGQICQDAVDKAYDCSAKAIAALNSVLANRVIKCTPLKADGKRFIGNCTADVLDVGTEMVRAGWALVRPDFLSKEAATQLCAVEAEAAASKRGLWQGEFEIPYFVKGGHKKTREQVSCP